MKSAPITDDMQPDPDDELLVAYLDGELQRDERTAVENRLLDDGSLRSRLRQLQSGWDMLEELPATTPNSKLVETTLELAVADIVKTSSRMDSKTQQSSVLRRLRFPLGVIVACLAATVLTFVAGIANARYQFRSELKDLAIAENFDAFNNASNLDLMRQLAANSDFSRMVKASRESDELADDTVLIATVPIDQREQAIADLPIEQRTQLYSRWDRYQRSDEKTRAKIREVANIVSKQTDQATLIETMRAYAIWRETLPKETVDLIESSTGDERVSAIAGAIDQTMIAISERASRKLSDDAIESIYFVLRQILQRRIDKLPSESIAEYNELKVRSGRANVPEWFTMHYLFGSRSERRRGIPAPKFLGNQTLPLRLEEIQWIRLVLAREDLAMLDKLTGGDPLLEEMTLKTWAEEAIRRNTPWPRRDDATSLQRYLDLPSERRDEFELMPPKEILEELSRPWGRDSG